MKVEAAAGLDSPLPRATLFWWGPSGGAGQAQAARHPDRGAQRQDPSEEAPDVALLADQVVDGLAVEEHAVRALLHPAGLQRLRLAGAVVPARLTAVGGHLAGDARRARE